MSKIEWTDATWNPIIGCTRVSAGCDHCYAAKMALRLSAMGQTAYDGLANKKHFTGVVRCLDDRLEQPLRWRKPRMIFVCSMSDLFHPSVSFDFIDRVFAVMALCPQHTFQVLTKRPERMVDYLVRCEAYEDDDKILGDTGIGNVLNGLPYYLLGECGEKPGGNENWRWNEHETAEEHGCDPGCGIAVPGYWEYTQHPQPILIPWPLPNVWLGTSVEDQAAADERIPHLLKCPAAVRFLSVEPMLGPVDIGMSVATCECCPRWPSRWVRLNRPVGPDLPHLVERPEYVADAGIYRADSNKHGALSVDTPDGSLGIKPNEFDCLPAVDWVIFGGESGPGARVCDVAWIRDGVRQCREAGVPAFVKQLGASVCDSARFAFSESRRWPEGIAATHRPNGTADIALRHPKGGDPSEWPEDLRVREWPKMETADM